MKTALSRSVPASRAVALLLAAALGAAAFAQPVSGEGEVRKVDLEGGRLTFKHGELPALDMPGMTMVVRVRDATWLKPLQPGDKVRFTLERIHGQYTITALEAAP